MPADPPAPLAPGRTYRLITRSTMDGLACAALLQAAGVVDGVTFAHPADVRSGVVPVGPGDVLAALPYVPGCAAGFDHNASETELLGLGPRPAACVADPGAPSAARVVWDAFGGAGAFPGMAPDLIAAADKAGAGRFTRAEVLAPEGWDLLAFIADPRTGLGRHRDFNISNYQLMLRLAGALGRAPVGEILADPDVAARVDTYFDHQLRFREQLERCTEVRGRLAVLDLRGQEVIWAGNRFVLDALFPKAGASLRVFWGRSRQNTVFALARSIFSPDEGFDAGALARAHGGHGRAATAECQVDNARAEGVKEGLIRVLCKP